MELTGEAPDLRPIELAQEVGFVQFAKRSSTSWTRRGNISKPRTMSDRRLNSAAMENEDEGWKEWIKTEDDDGTPRFKKVIVDWLAAPIEWTEDMPDNATAQDSAKRFFEHENLATLDELGVSIVEGESPGGTYYAAELNKKIEEANEITQKLGLPYRFREKRKGTA